MPGYAGANVPTNSSYTDWVPIKELVIQSQSSVELKHNNEGVVFDNTYRVYKFVIPFMRPATDNVNFEFQVNAEGETGFNETITSAAFEVYHTEGGSTSGPTYATSSDQGNGTSYQHIFSTGIGYGLDEIVSGELYLYDPSSTVFVKHFMANGNGYKQDNGTRQLQTAGYINTTNKINEISFKFSSGNIKIGRILMYGLAT